MLKISTTCVGDYISSIFASWRMRTFCVLMLSGRCLLLIKFTHFFAFETVFFIPVVEKATRLTRNEAASAIAGLVVCNC